ncbi:MAG: apolipoprotein N-acyltransferase, partial [Myxococcota bacterium]
MNELGAIDNREVAEVPKLLGVLGALVPAFGAGLALTAAFPVAVPAFGPEPLFDAVPRELLALVAAAYWYRESQRRRYWTGAVAAFAHFMSLLFWLLVAMGEFGKMPWYQSVPALSLLSAYCALYLAALAPLTAMLMARVRLPGPLLFAASLVFLEWLRTHALTGFPWGVWGYSQARNLPLANLASIAGVYGVSALIAGVGAACVDAWRERRWPLGALVFTLGAHVLGAAIWLSDREPPDAQPLRVALLQGNIRQEVKNRGVVAGARIAAVYKQLADQAQAGSDLVVWPESAWPYALKLNSTRFPVERDVPVVVGTVQRGDDGTGRVAHNSSVYVGPGGVVQGSQHKLHLVPFGEYVPMRWLLPVERVVPGMVDFTPGEQAAPLGDERIGVLICYDGIFPAIGRAHALAGAELLANITNDAWYGVTSGPLHHLDFYVFRAIETGRYVVRATNTGYSAVVQPT